MNTWNICYLHTSSKSTSTEFFVESMKMMEYASPCSSPPTPPSPLPISVGPGSQHYLFSSSPSPSPPFSPHSSRSGTSPENVPLLVREELANQRKDPSAFSLDQGPRQGEVDKQSSSCLKDLLEWLLLKCCRRSLPP